MRFSRRTSAGCGECRTAAPESRWPESRQRPPASATPPRPGAAANEVVGGVGHQDAEDHIELECAHQASAPLGRRKLRNVDRAQHRRSADAQPADEAEDHEGRPAPGQPAAQGGNHIKHRSDAQRLASAQLLPHHARAKRSHHRADEPDGHRPALALRAQAVELDQRINGAGDHYRVEAEEQAAQRAGQRGLDQVEVGSHGRWFLEFQIILQTGSATGKPG